MTLPVPSEARPWTETLPQLALAVSSSPGVPTTGVGAVAFPPSPTDCPARSLAVAGDPETVATADHAPEVYRKTVACPASVAPASARGDPAATKFPRTATEVPKASPAAGEVRVSFCSRSQTPVPLRRKTYTAPLFASPFASAEGTPTAERSPWIATEVTNVVLRLRVGKRRGQLGDLRPGIAGTGVDPGAARIGRPADIVERQPEDREGAVGRGGGTEIIAAQGPGRGQEPERRHALDRESVDDTVAVKIWTRIDH
jgi:hypothetical protein